ncbi:ABC transporter substrate-binding protein [Anaerocolumna sp. MB42-C2]|uniref:ABC transporter substrate-binding protein n=1 Tax=Anaerocolumna sp. MB42-C2 TaxID=3070997 RepID=UPI0027E19DE6|nr:sugar ABC transporter substrate-binding protein [Anaerocolumna sp. MB42-C2]WMJ88813.1 sugar ABC transporter substrate-binding protein [Anaerocolumna sp. MB42-C2]
MKLRKLLALTMATIMVMSLSACGNSKQNSGSTDTANTVSESSGEEATQTADGKADATKEVSADTLTVAIWDTNQEPGLRKIMDDFTAKTGTKVEIQVTPWDQYWTMLEAGATGGTLPDVFWMHSNEIAKYSEYEMLLDLTDRIDKSSVVDMSKFPQDIVNIYKWQGEKQYAMPKDIDTIALWYNKTMFDEAGLSYPDDSWTWDDFKDACKKLTKPDGSQYGFTLAPSSNQDGWYNMVYDMGGTVISDDKKASGFDQPGTIKAIDFASGLVKEGLTPPYETIAENNANALFEAGKVAMITQGSWMLADLCNNDYVKANCDVAVLPKDATTGRRASIYNGLGWAAAANTNKPDQAWALIEYLGSQEAQQKQSDLGIVISAYEGTVSNWTKAYPDFNTQAYLDMMKDLVIRPYSKTTVTWENMISEKLVDAWTGKKSVEDVCKDITTEMNATLAEE